MDKVKKIEKRWLRQEHIYLSAVQLPVCLLVGTLKAVARQHSHQTVMSQDRIEVEKSMYYC